MSFSHVSMLSETGIRMIGFGPGSRRWGGLLLFECLFGQATGVNRDATLVPILLQRLTGHAFGELLYMAGTRHEALRWEQENYGIGGPGWKDLVDARGRNSLVIQVPRESVPCGANCARTRCNRI